MMCSKVCSSSSHLPAALKAIHHLCTLERNNPTPMRSRLSLTQDDLDRYSPNGFELTSGMKVHRRQILLFYSTFHLGFVQHPRLLSDL